MSYQVKGTFAPPNGWANLNVSASSTVDNISQRQYSLINEIGAGYITRTTLRYFLNKTEGMIAGTPLIGNTLPRFGAIRRINDEGYTDTISEKMRPYLIASFGRRISGMFKDIKTHKDLHLFFVNNFWDLVTAARNNRYQALTLEEVKMLEGIREEIGDRGDIALTDSAVHEELREWAEKWVAHDKKYQVYVGNMRESDLEPPDEDNNEDEDEYEDDEGDDDE